MNLICACCGGNAPSKKQWWNQDTGYGICARCFKNVIEHEFSVLHNAEAIDYALKCYGKPGLHHSLEQPDGMEFSRIELLNGKAVFCYKVPANCPSCGTPAMFENKATAQSPDRICEDCAESWRKAGL